VRDRAVAWLVSADPAVDVPPASERVVVRPAPASVEPIRAPATIEAIDVSVRFGGLQALDRVGIHARPGEILGLMGPNGAGKTTLFDVLSGNVSANSGRVLFAGDDITDLPPHRRARLGIGRTYQQARLFGELTTVESVAIALEQRHRSRLLPTLAAWPTTFRIERRQRAAAYEVLELLEIAGYADRCAAELPTGIRRLAELACVIALQPTVLLLDEPTAGFTPREIASFLPVVNEVRSHLDATIVMIDHDIHVMRDLVDRLYVLAVGHVIAHGPASVLETDTAVRDVYTGVA
jgi:ABC-type branched-subunit amino acid transport system ATPase component